MLDVIFCDNVYKDLWGEFMSRIWGLLSVMVTHGSRSMRRKMAVLVNLVEECVFALWIW